MQRKWQRRWKRAVVKMVVAPIFAAGLFFSVYSPALANPTGATVTAGTAAIAQDGSKMTITTSDKVVMNWQNYNIAKGETVQYIQPSASSVALNRVIGNEASSIYGTLTANGKVFLINPNGVLFAPGSAVNVGGLVASTKNISDSDFLNAKYTFSGDSTASVVNQGTITANGGGYVALLGAQAKNEGIIVANQGTVALASGNAVTLDLAKDGFLNLVVDQAALSASVANSGVIQADGGKVYMSAKTAEALASTVVNNSGKIQAKSITSKNGVIILDGGTSGTVVNSGTLDASGKTSGQTGGTVKVLGETVKLANGTSIDVSGDAGGGTALIGGAAQGGSSEYAATTTTVTSGATINADAITTGNSGNVVVWANGDTTFAGRITARGGSISGSGGNVETSGKQSLTVSGAVNAGAINGTVGTWLLDPYNLTVDDAAASSINRALVTTNVTLQTTASGTSGYGTVSSTGNGDIIINSALDWKGSGVLTLSAYRNIYLNGNITITDTGSASHAGFDLKYGTQGTSTGGTDSTATYSIASGKSITLNNTGSPTLAINGKSYTLVYTLSDLASDISTNSSGYYALGKSIDVSGTTYTSSPISTTLSGTFDGLGNTITGLTISTGSMYVGLFSETASNAVIRNLGLVDVSVTASNSYDVGGLVGLNNGSITSSYSMGSVSGTGYYAGGLVGFNNGSITSSYSTSSVSGTGDNVNNVGGLVGSNGGSITSSYSTGTVSGVSVGGLVGDNYGSIMSSYSEGSVSGDSIVGGLVGHNFGSITSSYSTGSVSGTGGYVGGLVGYNNGSITSSYSTGTVSGANDVGGLVGVNDSGSITSSYSTGAVSGATFVGGLVGYNSGSITSSYSTGTVSGVDIVGGLVGVNNGTITSSYSACSVSGTGDAVGGLVGYNNGSITSSYSTGTVSGAYDVGGLVGESRGSITSSYSAGSVRGHGTGNYVGGLVGVNHSGSITSSYSTGVVSGVDGVGGLVGYNSGTVTSCYWDKNTSGMTNGIGGGTITGATAFTTSEMQYSSNYDSNWDFSSTWGIVSGQSYPYLLWRYTNTPQVVSGTLSFASSAYDVNLISSGKELGTTTTGANGYYYFLLDNGTISITDAVLTYTTSSSLKGSAVSRIIHDNASLTGMDITSGVVSIYGSSAVDVTGILQKAIGSLTIDNTLYSVSATDDITVNGNLSVTASGAISQSGALTVTGATTLAAVNSDAITTTYDIKLANSGNDFQGVVTVSRGGNVNLQDENALIVQGITATGDVLLTAKKLTIANSTAGGSGITSNGGNVTLVATGTDASSFTNEIGVTGITVPTSKYWRIYLEKPAYGTTNGLNYNFTQYGTAYNNGKATIYGSGNGLIYGSALNLSVALTGTVSSKIYDGTTATTLNSSNFTLSGLIGGTAIYTVSSYSANYNSKSVANANAVTSSATASLTSGVTDSSGKGVYGYTFSGVIDGSLSSSITAKALTVTALGSNKIYNGLTDASATYSDDRVSGDVLNISGTAAFYDKNVGTGKAVSVSGITISGTDAGNYSLQNTSTTTAANITARALTVAAIGTNRIYDGTTGANVTLSDNAVAGDNLTVSSAGATFVDKNVGTAKTVTVNGITLTGTDAGNYTVANKAMTTADITPAILTYTANTVSLLYGTTIPVLTGTVVGFVNSETEASVTTGTKQFNTVATKSSTSGNYAINGSGLTANYGNYRFVQAAGNAVALSMSPSPSFLTATNISVLTVGAGTSAGAAPLTITGEISALGALDAAPLLTIVDDIAGAALIPDSGATVTLTPPSALMPGSGATVTSTPSSALIPDSGATVTPTPSSTLIPGSGATVTPTPPSALMPGSGATVTLTPPSALMPGSGATVTSTPSSALIPDSGATVTSTPSSGLIPNSGATVTLTPPSALIPDQGLTPTEPR